MCILIFPPVPPNNKLYYHYCCSISINNSWSIYSLLNGTFTFVRAERYSIVYSFALFTIHVRLAGPLNKTTRSSRPRYPPGSHGTPAPRPTDSKVQVDAERYVTALFNSHFHKIRNYRSYTATCCIQPEPIIGNYNFFTLYVYGAYETWRCRVLRSIKTPKLQRGTLLETFKNV